MKPIVVVKAARGFTLIEVLVALAIVAVGMSAVMATLTSSSNTSVFMRDRTFAQWIALNRISEVRLQAVRPTKGKQDGEVEFALRKWRWEQEVDTTEIPGVMRLTVRVRPSDASGDAKRSWFAEISGITGAAVAPAANTGGRLWVPVIQAPQT